MAVDSFFTQKKMKKNTRESYQGWFARFNQASPNRHLLNMTDIEFQRVMERFKEVYGENSRLVALSFANSYYCFHGRSDNPASSFPRPRRPVQAKKVDEEEVRRIISAIPQTSIQGLSDRAMFYSYARTGAQVRDWTWADLQVDGQWVKYRWRQNNGTEHWTPLPNDVWFEISTYLHHSGRLHKMQPDEYIFTAGNGAISYQELSRRLNRYARLAGVEGKFRPNDLRKVNLRPSFFGDVLSNLAQRSPRDRKRLHGIGRRSR